MGFVDINKFCRQRLTAYFVIYFEWLFGWLACCYPDLIIAICLYYSGLVSTTIYLEIIFVF